MKKTLAILLGLCLSLIAAQAFAQMGSGHMMDGSRYSGGYGLTEEQVEASREIHAKYQDSFAELSEQIWSKRAQISGELAKDNVDRGRVEKLAGEVGDLMSKGYQMRVKMFMDMREKGLSFGACSGMMGGGMMHGGMMGGGYHGGMMGGGMKRGYHDYHGYGN
jgi:Spy/CpxP family protein refolding chaperone